jgi:serine phosphatase RsbU (regulator of sigma subunit)
MPPATPRLTITDADGERVVPIEKTRFTIGRNADTDLRLEGTDISRLHAEIVATNGTYVLNDMKSSFGTFVNGERTARATLAHGDQLRFGQGAATVATIVFQLDAVRRDTESIEKQVASAATELRQVASLLKGLRALGSGRVVDEVLALVLDSAIDVTGAERGFIMLANQEKELEFKLARARGKITLSGKTFATSRKIPEAVFASGEPAIVSDLASEDLLQHAGTIALGIRYVLCMPLHLVRYVEHADDRGADESIGVLYLDSRERGELNSASTLTALDALAAEAALAIENARLYREALDKAKVEQELKVAAAIQQALMPPANHDGAFCQASGTSVACRAVGGDFFDYIDLPGDRFGFILGDVSGKGPPAALLATAALGMFSAEASYQTSAAALMARLNHGLLRRAIDARYLTSFYAIVSANGDLLYSNAGHNPPLLVSRAGVRRLSAGGSPLGLFSDMSYDEETVRLERGDVVVVFSDGVTEALNPAGDEFADERLIESVSAHRGKAPQELLEAVVADLHAFCGDATQTDDVTIVAMRYTG